MYAKWAPESVSIVYDPNGGRGNLIVQNAFCDKNIKLLPNRFTNNGRTFYGWSTVKNPGSADPIYPELSGVKNLTYASRVTLYAQWR